MTITETERNDNKYMKLQKLLSLTRKAVDECGLIDPGDKIAVGVDIQIGMVAIKGWTEVSKTPFLEFCKTLQQMGVSTVICTDISKDGMLSGTNLELYQTLNSQFSMNIIASGGVSTLDDIQKLKNLGMYGAILGKALYTGTLDLKEALLAAQ